MYPPPEQWEEGRKLLRRQWLSGGGGKGHVPWAHGIEWEDGSIMAGFPALYEKEIPWVFPDISMRKLKNSMRNIF